MEPSGTMQAVVAREPGGPEVLEVREVSRLATGPDEIRVRVASSGVNRADLMQRRGHYPPPPGWPERIPGLEFAGTVLETGARVLRWQRGDRVMGLVGGGGYAEEVVLHERTAVRVPDGIDVVEAGAIPEVFMTAFDALFRQMELGLGETVLIHAVGSGVGTAALQLARAAGARTVGTSRTPEKVDRALSLGLDAGIVADEGWPERAREALGEGGADVILDLVGADYLRPNLELLASGGRQIVVGVPGGSVGEIHLRALMRSRANVRGTVLRARPLEEKARLAREFEHRIVPLFERDRVQPVIERVFDPGRAPDAHRRMEKNLNFGKLLLRWEDGPSGRPGSGADRTSMEEET